MTFGGSSPELTWTADDDRRTELQAKEYEEGSMRSLLVNLAPPGEALQSPVDAEDKSPAEAVNK